MKKLVEGLNHITAHVDCHNIVSQVSDYCLFYPRFSNQDHNLMTQFMQDVSNHGDFVTWGSSTLSSFSNWVGIKKILRLIYQKFMKDVQVSHVVPKKCGVASIS